MEKGEVKSNLVSIYEHLCSVDRCMRKADRLMVQLAEDDDSFVDESVSLGQATEVCEKWSEDFWNRHFRASQGTTQVNENGEQHA